MSPRRRASARLGWTISERWRPEFPILEKTVYLISNSLGAMPRGAARGLAEYAEIWATRGIRAWEETWWELAGRVGDKIAAIVGAPPGSVSLHENVTTASAVALSCLEPAGARRRIVCPESGLSVAHLPLPRRRSAVASS